MEQQSFSLKTPLLSFWFTPSRVTFCSLWVISVTSGRLMADVSTNTIKAAVAVGLMHVSPCRKKKGTRLRCAYQALASAAIITKLIS
jgi:hypothetical protein